MVKNLFKKILTPKWLIIIGSVLVVAIAGIVVGLNYNNWFAPKETAEASTQLFFNVDGPEFAYQTQSGTTSRPIDKDDGYYHVLFLSQGRQVKRRVKANKDLINKIDSLDVMGLVFDSKGIVTGVKTLKEMGGSYACEYFYVSAVDGLNVTVNSASGLNGIEESIKLCSKTKYYDISGSSGEVGIPVKNVQLDDRILAIKDKTGDIVDVFITSRYVEPHIYYNLERMWDSKFGITSRKPDAEGCYSYLFAYNGQQVTLKTKKTSVATEIDSQAGKCLCLEFDEEGYISLAKAAAKYIGGGIYASYYDVTNIEGNEITSYRNLAGAAKGQSQTARMARGAKCYNVCDAAENFKGEETDVRLDDRVHGIKNSKGEIVVLYIVGRSVDSDFYWNIDRKYDKNTASTTRTPNAQGYYEFLFATRGKQVTLKTKDKEIASKIDSYAGHTMGLKLSGDTVVKVYDPGLVGRGGVVASYFNIDKIEGKQITATKYDQKASDYGKTVQFEIGDNCEMYVVGGTYLKFIGEATDKLYVGDQIHCYKALNGKAAIVYVVNRGVMTKIPVKTSVCPDCGKNVTWYQWYGGNVSEDGHYILMDNNRNSKQCNISPAGLTIGKNVEESKKINVTVDTNGKDIVSSGRVFAVNQYCNLTVLDSSCGKSLLKSSIGSAANDRGYGIWQREYSHVTFNGPTLDTSDVYNTSTGTTLYLANSATFTMNGGNIKCGNLNVVRTVNNKTNSTSNTVGNIYMAANTSFTLNDGVVSGGTATPYGTITVDANGNKTAIDTNNKDFTVSGGMFYTTANTNLTVNGGMITGGKANGGVGGNIVTSASNGVITVNGGAITGGVAVPQTYSNGKKEGGHGGNIYSSCPIYMNGGEISGGVAYNAGGGNLSMNKAGSKLIMTGGVIKNGSSPVANKGNVWFWNAAGATKNENEMIDVLDMSGGLITEDAGYVHPAGMSGGGAYIAKKDKTTDAKGVTTYYNSRFNVRGTAKIYGANEIGVNFESGKYLVNGSPLSGDANVAIKTLGLFTKDKSYKKYYSSAINGGKIVESKDGLVNVKTKTQYCDVCKQTAEFVAVTGANYLIQDSGHYYLDANFNSTGQLEIRPNGKLTEEIAKEDAIDVTLDLNGKTLNVTNRALAVQMYCNLNLYDSVGTGQITTNATKNTENSYFALLRPNATMSMYSGTVNLSNVVTTSSGAGSIINKDTTFNMYGGKIIGGTSSKGGVFNVLGNLNLYGGEITGGKTTSDLGGNIYVDSSAVVKAENNVKVTGGTDNSGNANNIYLNSNILALNNLTSGAELNIATTGVVALDAESQKPYIYSDLGQPVNVLDGTVYIGDETNNHIHKLNVKSEDKTVGDNNKIFLAWSDATKLPTATGNYYLTCDVTTSQNNINGADVNICLNGHTVTGANRTFLVGNTDVASLSICDCQDCGKILRKTTTYGDKGGIVLGNNYGTVNLFSGTLDASNTDVQADKTYTGGAVYISKAMNMYGGTIIGAKSSTGGGSVYINKGAVFNMSGGEVKNGNSKVGGNIYCHYDGGTAQFNMSGGKLTGGMAQYVTKTDGSKDGGHGGNIYCGAKVTISGGEVTGGKATNIGGGNISANNANSVLTLTGGTVSGGIFESNPLYADVNYLNGKVNVSGSPVASIYIKDKTLNVGELTDGAMIKVASNKSIIAENKGEYLKYFDGINKGETVGVDTNNNLVIVHGHKLCVSSDNTEMEGYEKLTFTPWSDPAKLPTTAGNYYLTCDVTTSQNNINGVDVNICLNGHTVTGTNRTFLIGNTATASLSICDCQACGKILRKTTTYGDKGGIVLGSTNGTFNLFSGTLDASNTDVQADKTYTGGAVYVTKAMNMYGGTIIGAKSSSNGGSVYINKGATFNMSGGEIKNGNSKVGGNIYCHYDGGTAQFNMSGGKVTGGTAQYLTNTDGSKDGGHSGNIYCGAKVTISGGEVTGGKATATGGGNIMANNANSVLTLSGGKVTGGIFESNTAFADIYYSNGTVNVSGTAVANIYVNGKTLTVGELTTGSDIGIAMKTKGVFANGAAAYKDFFRAIIKDAEKIVVSGSDLALAEK